MTSKYYPILESYNVVYLDIQDIINNTNEYTLAIEADTTSNGNTMKKQLIGEVKNGNNQNLNNDKLVTSDNKVVDVKQKKTLVDTIADFIKKISQMIDKVTMFIQNRLKLVLDSDKSFFKQLNSQRASIKPMSGFKAINYSYKATEVERIVVKLGNDVDRTIKALVNLDSDSNDGRIATLVKCNYDQMTSILLKPYSKNKNDRVTMKSFTDEIINTFRGEKKEFLYSASSIPQIMTIAQSTTSITDKVNAKLNTSKTNLSVLKNLQSQASHENSAKKLDAITKRVTRATQLYNIYLTTLKVYHELLLERSLSARELLRKFYQF